MWEFTEKCDSRRRNLEFVNQFKRGQGGRNGYLWKNKQHLEKTNGPLGITRER